MASKMNDALAVHEDKIKETYQISIKNKDKGYYDFWEGLISRMHLQEADPSFDYDTFNLRLHEINKRYRDLIEEFFAHINP
jgi:hypothetical protein